MTPANDNEPKSKLAEQLTAFLALRNTPDHKPEPLTSNWTTEPADALVEPEVRRELHGEQRLEITPSIQQIYREMHKPAVRNERGQIVAIGSLHFSDGTQTEKAFTIGPDGDVIQYDRRMPTGAMLGCDERLTVSAGAGTQPAKVTISNARLAERLGVEHVQYIPGKRKRRTGKAYSASEAQVLLDEAVANTAVMPSTIKMPPGLASGTAQASDQFVGMKIGSTGKGGAASWVDTFSALQEWEAFQAAFADLPAKTKGVLKRALVAGSLTEVGVEAGQSPNYADKKSGGRRALIAANDNFSASIKRYGAIG